MSISNQKQFVQENETWERSLDFFKQENAILKTRLSVIIDNTEDKTFLILAEDFQNRFILRDELINELKKDVIALGKYINDNYNNDNLANKILIKQEKIRNEIGFFEEGFSGLKYEFNKSIANFL